MTTLVVRRKWWRLGGRFIVTTQQGQVVYTAQGDFWHFPKQFVIDDRTGQEIAQVTRQKLTSPPVFELRMRGRIVTTWSPKIRLWRLDYGTANDGIQFLSNWANLTFSVVRNNRPIAIVHEPIHSLGHAYKVEVKDDHYIDLVMAMLLMVDHVKVTRWWLGLGNFISFFSFW